MAEARIPIHSHEGGSLPFGLGLVAHQFRFDFQSLLRNTQAAVFTVALPILFLVLFVALFGNHTLLLQRHPDVRVKYSTFYVAGLTSLGVISAAFTNLVVAVVAERESGILKRRRSTPVPAYSLIVGRALVSVVLALFMGALLMAIGAIFYGATPPSHTVPGIAVSIIVGTIAFCALGYGISTFIRSEDSAQPLIQITLLPLYFISGVFVPTTQIPSWLSDVASIFPVKHLSAALLNAYTPTTTGAGLSGGDLLVMAAWGVGGLTVALWRFSWSPRGT